MSYGWMGEILRVDLTTGKVSKEPTMKYDGKKFLGGRGINDLLLFNEVSPKVGAFDADNRLIWGVGPLGATRVPAPGRCQLTFKSPYPSHLGESNCGGHIGSELKFAGYDHLIIQGRAEKPVYLWISDNKVKIRDASHLWGKNTWETQNLIRKELGDEKIRIACIGQGGENLVKFASIMTEGSNAFGRCGGGAVMGSKNLKAVALRGSKKVKVAKLGDFERLRKEVYAHIENDPMFIPWKENGSPLVFDLGEDAGIIAVKNYWRTGRWEGNKKIGPKSLRKYIVKRKGCFGCPVACHGYYEVTEGPFAGIKGEGPEFETLSALGCKCLCDELDALLQMNNLCNQYGLDTISTGNVFCSLMDFYERGLITEKDTDGIAMVWGDPEAMIKMIHKIARREGVGDLLSEDIVDYAKKVGEEAEYLVMHNKGVTHTSLVPQSMVGTLLSYSSAGRGSHHLSGLPTPQYMMSPQIARAACGFEEGGDPLSYHPLANARIVIFYQHLFRILDSINLCKFVYGHAPFWHDSNDNLKKLPVYLAKLFSVVTGIEMSKDDLFTAAERIFNVGKSFIVREGMTRQDDMPSERVFNEGVEGEHSVGPVPLPRVDKQKFNKILDTYYQERGWDSNGKPAVKKLEELGIKQIVGQII